jgi:hypothetical protein
LKEISGELAVLLALSGDVYKASEGGRIPADVDWERVLELASKNRMLYYCVTKILKTDVKRRIGEGLLELIKKLKELGDEWLLILKMTLGELSDVLDEEEYLLLKSYRSYPYITYDVDVLVRNLEDTKNALSDHNFIIKNTEKYKAVARREGLLPIGIHGRVSWGSVTVLDEELLWEKSREVEVQDRRVRVPNAEGDLLTYLAHINFELYYIALGDLLYIYNLSEKADWDMVMRQSRKYGWARSMETTIATINALHRHLYGEPSPIEKHIPVIADIKPEIPYKFSLHSIVENFAEKEALKQLAWQLPFYIYRRLRLKSTHSLTYLHSYLYPPRLR